MALGRFITVEGGEGSGKSTQARLLARKLAVAGVDVAATREPGGAPGAEALRPLLVEGSIRRWTPMTEVLLHYAARRDHLDHTVLPALESGTWVVSDRFADSTLVYQGYGQGLDPEIIASLHRLVVGAFAPDLTLILDVPVDVGLTRAKRRAGREDRYERMGEDFHRRLREGFLEIARREPGRCRLIDASDTVERVHRAVCAAVCERFDIELQAA